MRAQPDLPRTGADDSRNMSAPRKAGHYPHWALTQEVIGAAYEVHRELGPGFLEKVYETALSLELSRREIEAVCQAEIPVIYKGSLAGSYFADILVRGKVICEVKAVNAIVPAHEAQLIHYLKATGLEVGLLLNFGAGPLQFKRLVFSK